MLKVIPIMLLSGILLVNTGSAMADTNHPLFEAIKRGQTARVKALLTRSRLGVNARYVQSETPLAMAVRAQNSEMVSILLAAGANPNQIIDVGMTVFDLALKEASTDIEDQTARDIADIGTADGTDQIGLHEEAMHILEQAMNQD